MNASRSDKVPAQPAADDDGAYLPRPAPAQAAWQDCEVGLFIDVPFPDRPPLPGKQSEAQPAERFNPDRLDTDQWMEAIKLVNGRYSVFVAKGGDGFLKWQTDAYPYGVRQAVNWRGGKGDVVKEYADACRRNGFKPGYYCCLHWNSYLEIAHIGRVNWGRTEDPAKQARYARTCEQMIRELLTRFGETGELWFDDGYMKVQDGGPDLYRIFEKHGPDTMYFQANDWSSIRWCGNEEGHAGYPCWSTVSSKDGVMHDNREREHGDVNGSVWPAECDTPMPGRFWGWKDEYANQAIDPHEQLIKMYYNTVGRNANLLIEAPTTSSGLIHESYMKHYERFGKEIRRRFAKALAETSGDGDELTLILKKPAKIDHVIIMEDIMARERIREYVVEGLTPGNLWEKLCDGISVGHKRIQQFGPTEVAKVRLRVTKRAATPKIRKLAVYDTVHSKLCESS